MTGGPTGARADPVRRPQFDGLHACHRSRDTGQPRDLRLEPRRGRRPAIGWKPKVHVYSTQEVLHRIEKGHVRPNTSHELSYAVVSALARRQEAYIETLTMEVWQLEQQVTGGGGEELLDDRNPSVVTSATRGSSTIPGTSSTGCSGLATGCWWSARWVR
jgi:hypothetical protein